MSTGSQSTSHGRPASTTIDVYFPDQKGPSEGSRPQAESGKGGGTSARLERVPEAWREVSRGMSFCGYGLLERLLRAPESSVTRVNPSKQGEEQEGDAYDDDGVTVIDPSPMSSAECSDDGDDKSGKIKVFLYRHGDSNEGSTSLTSATPSSWRADQPTQEALSRSEKATTKRRVDSMLECDEPKEGTGRADWATQKHTAPLSQNNKPPPGWI